jgi:hypothetical protein
MQEYACICNCVPSPFGSRRGSHIRLRGGGVGVTIRTMGHTEWYSNMYFVIFSIFYTVGSSQDFELFEKMKFPDEPI